MKVDDCYQLGYLTKPHGLKGELIAFLDVDFPEEYENLESVLLLRQNELVPFFVTSCALQTGQKVRLVLEDVDTREAAELLVGSQLYLPLSALPNLTGNQFYYHEVVGFKLLDGAIEVGVIDSIVSTGRQDLFSVKSPKDDEILVPITDEVIKELDRAGRRIITVLPEGLVDVFTSTDES
ncbi:MAG: ribosome maturation factor RimM [Cyclobacteriaceae bacterium]